MKIRILAFAALVAIVSVGSSYGQTSSSRGGTVAPVDLLHSDDLGGGYIIGGGHSSTYEEGVLRGAGALARGAGDFNYLSAEALKSIEQARSLNIDNRMRALESYWQAKQMNYENTLGRIKRFSTEQMAAIARKEAPDRLAPHQYDPFHGKLHWPVALMTKDFEAHREALNELFATRTTHDVGPETQFHADVRELTAEMESMLLARIESMPPMEYTAAKKFINGLEREASLVPGTAATDLVSR